MSYTTCEGFWWTVTILFLPEKLAQGARLRTSSCGRAVAAAHRIVHRHHGEVGGHVDSWRIVEEGLKSSEEASCPHVWTFNPAGKKGSPEEEDRSSLHVVGEWGIQSDHNKALTPAHSLRCGSSVLCSLLPPAREASHSPAVSSFTLLVPFPPFSNLPPALLCLTSAIAPCDPLFTIETQGSSHDSDFLHSHLCNGRRQENKVLWEKLSSRNKEEKRSELLSREDCWTDSLPAICLVLSALFSFTASASGFLQVNGKGGVTLHSVHCG